MANQRSLRQQLKAVPEDAFTRRWAGFATMKQKYQMKRGEGGAFHQFVQRTGERTADWRYKAFLSTADGDEVEALTLWSSPSVGTSKSSSTWTKPWVGSERERWTSMCVTAR
jgi:hypothetical protein